MLPLIQNAHRNPTHTAIVVDDQSYTYQQLLNASAATATTLLHGESDLNEARVAFMMPPGFGYVQVQWGIWRAGGVAVPLALSYPLPSLRYVIEDTSAKIILATPAYAAVLAPLVDELGLQLFVLATDALALSSQPATLPT